MVKIIMHGCNGHMGQVISNIVEKDANAQIVAGIDIADQGKNSYPVFTNIDDCQVEADAVIDFSSQHIGIEVSSLFGLTIENEVRC